MRPNTVLDATGRPVPAAAEPLSRWDRRPPGVIFREGFRPRVAPVSIDDFRNTDDISLHLHRYINDHVRSIFVSTTRPVRSSRNGPVEIWRPPTIGGRWRYEIFAYGGVDILASFENQREIRYAEQQEITFIGGIRAGLVRSATEYDEGGRVLSVWHNVHFNPLLNGDYAPRVTQLPELPEPTYSIRFFDPPNHDAPNAQSPGPDDGELRRRREAIQGVDSDESNGNFSGYQLVPDLGASNPIPALRVRRACMLRPGGRSAFFFADTRFATLNLNNSSNLEDTLAPGGVQSLVNAWPALHEAGFPAIDAMIPNPANENEAYVFFREKYILLDITTRTKVFEAKTIVEQWPSLMSAGFTTVDAAVVVQDGTAYFFRGNQYVRVRIKPGTNDDTVVGSGPKSIRGNWPVLEQVSFDTVDSILPHPHIQNTFYFFSGNDYIKMAFQPGRPP